MTQVPPKITFFVSAYCRPDALACFLYSLRCQTISDWQAIILDNAVVDVIIEKHVDRIMQICDSRIKYLNPQMDDCYPAVNDYLHLAEGEWIATPSDDTYYVPEFIEIMTSAGEQNGWDFVYCDTLYDPRRTGKWEILNVLPSPCQIDKVSFIVRRDKFTGFIPDPMCPWGRATQSDGYTAADLANRLPHGKAPGVLVVHP